VHRNPSGEWTGDSRPAAQADARPAGAKMSRY
jgi:hypothetical protein